MSDTYKPPVIIVCDTPERARPVEEALIARGHDANIVVSDSADEMRGREKVALAFVDLACGAETVREVATRSRQVIALGDGRSGDDVLLAFRAGARDFVDRAPDLHDLDAALERAAERERSREAVLEYQDRSGREHRLAVCGNTLTIGRDTTCDICLDSSVVSRFHARVECTDAGHVIVDVGSRHGIHVNTVPVKEQLLEDGDHIRLGPPGSPVVTFRSASLPGDPTGTGIGTGPQPPSSREMKGIASILDTFLTLKDDLLLDELLEIVVSRSIELADADRGMILLLDLPRSDATPPSPFVKGLPGLQVALARYQDGSTIEEAGIAISRRIPEEVLETGKGAILEDLLAPESAEGHSSTIEIGVRSAMCVPLRTRKVGRDPAGSREILGVLYVDSTSRSRPFSPRLLKAFESLASEAAQAIFNARLYRLSLEKRRIDEEIRIARSIQRDLLPRRDFENDWMILRASSQPCTEVGGDFLGYYVMGPDRVGLAVGDVSGKGIPAAILSATLDGICHGLAAHPDQGRDLGFVAQQINQYLVQKSSNSKFVSFFFGVLHEDGRLAYVNAGHNPPLHIDSKGKVESLRTGDMILGVFDDTGFTTGHAMLGSGDTLLLYSDGISEAPAESGERFGLERLISAALEDRGEAPGRIHDGILEHVREFLEGLAPADDVTLLVARHL